MVAAPSAAAAVLVLWAAGHAAFSPWVALPAALLAAVLAAWRWPTWAAQLSWDGQSWQVDGQGGAMAVMIDLGPWLLLRLTPNAPQRPMWIPVAAVEPPAARHALRAALYCRSSSAAQPGALSSPSTQPE
jgi:hypothetical protein